MVNINYKTIAAAGALVGSMLLPQESTSQEKNIKILSKIETVKDSTYVKPSDKKLDCDFTYNPKTEGTHKKSEAKKWNEKWNSDQAKLKAQKQRINKLEKDLLNSSNDTIIPQTLNKYDININVDNSRINNFYEAQNNQDSNKKTLSKLQIRGGLEADSDLVGEKMRGAAFGQVRLSGNKNSGLWVGPYVGFGFGKSTEDKSIDVYDKSLIDESSEMFLESAGTRDSSLETENLFRAGLRTSVDISRRVGLDLDLGIQNENSQLTNITESGNDKIIMAGNELSSKPYSFEKSNEDKLSKNNFAAELGINIKPAKNMGWYIGASVDLKKNFRVKTGWRFGGNKK